MNRGDRNQLVDARSPRSSTLSLYPVIEIAQSRRAQLVVCREAFRGGLLDNLAFDVEQHVDPLHRL